MAQQLLKEQGKITIEGIGDELGLSPKEIQEVLLSPDRIPFRGSEREGVYYKPSFFKQKIGNIKKVLKNQEKLTFQKIQEEFRIEREDISTVAQQVDTIEGANALYSKQLVTKAKNVLSKREKIKMADLTQFLDLTPKEVQHIIFPRLSVVTSNREGLYYGSTFWEGQIQVVYSKLRETPFPVSELSKDLGIVEEDFKQFIQDADLFQHHKTLYSSKDEWMQRRGLSRGRRRRIKDEISPSGLRGM